MLLWQDTCSIEIGLRPSLSSRAAGRPAPTLATVNVRTSGLPKTSCYNLVTHKKPAFLWNLFKFTLKNRVIHILLTQTGGKCVTICNMSGYVRAHLCMLPVLPRPVRGDPFARKERYVNICQIDCFKA